MPRRAIGRASLQLSRSETGRLMLRQSVLAHRLRKSQWQVQRDSEPPRKQRLAAGGQEGRVPASRPKGAQLRVLHCPQLMG